MIVVGKNVKFKVQDQNQELTGCDGCVFNISGSVICKAVQAGYNDCSQYKETGGGIWIEPQHKRRSL
jgi:hypothetical protein